MSNAWASTLTKAGMMRAWLAVLAAGVVAGACGRSDGASASWSGTIDTLASGQIVVHNPATPMRPADDAWSVTEELRIGSIDGDGADVFGRITAFTVDAAGRFWVLEGQSQELRVFDASGRHVRTVGRRGGGPGEFRQAVRVDHAPDGHIWVADPGNGRVSRFDTAGVYVDGRNTAGGFVIMPWPGGFDRAGRYYMPVLQPGEGFRIATVRHDAELTPLDTVVVPHDPIQRASFEHRPTPTSGLSAGIPFQGGLTWRVSSSGTVWALITDQYRLFEMADSDTLRTITREFTPVAVTDADREQAREDLKWFTDQGGRIDLSRLPNTKPPVRGFFVDGTGHVWVERVGAREDDGSLFDVFDADGRYVIAATLPFRLRTSPWPIVRDGVLYGVTEDDLEAQYLVRARIASTFHRD